MSVSTERGLIFEDPFDRMSESDDLLRTPDRSPGTALYEDLYHIDAAFIAWKSGHTGNATFDLFTRQNPFAGGFMLFTGLQPSLDFLRAFEFRQEELDWLKQTKHYEDDFLHFLAGLNFSGDIVSLDEGEIVFPYEPMVRVTAPFAEAMLLEAGLLRTIGISTLLATKAARIHLAAKGRGVADFAFRRAHAPFLAARSGYIGGTDSTSFVAAAKDFSIPSSGTIPHAVVQAFPDELTAFRTVAETMPEYTLLLDTYDVERAIGHAITVANEARASHGHRMLAVRLDSGDLGAYAQMVRTQLDEAGLKDVRIVVSGDIDEYKIEELLKTDAPIDGFGVGGNLGVGLGTIESGTVGGVIGAVYKLAWFSGQSGQQARLKLAGSKSTWPGVKEVYRVGDYAHDVIALADEPTPDGARSLLKPWITDGHLVREMPTIHDIRKHALANVAALPDWLKALTPDREYEVRWSDAIQELRTDAIDYYTHGE